MTSQSPKALRLLPATALAALDIVILRLGIPEEIATQGEAPMLQSQAQVHGWASATASATTPRMARSRLIMSWCLITGCLKAALATNTCGEAPETCIR